MTTLVIILLLAFLTETLVEFVFADLFEHIPAAEPFKWTIKYVAIAVGIGGAFVYGFDLIALLSQYLENTITATPFGITITGIAIGKGSNYLHQIISQFFPEPEG
jgi:hypothetical protein